MYEKEIEELQAEYDSILRPTKAASENPALLQAAIDNYRHREEFTYDPESDPLFSQYRDSYTKQGQLAMEDAIGKASAMTGGYGNSYAQQVGQQTFNGYMTALNDKIPELVQLAAANYDRKIGNMLTDISVLGAQVDREDQAYQNQLTEYYEQKTQKGEQLSSLKNAQATAYAADATADATAAAKTPTMSLDDLDTYAERLLPLVRETNGDVPDLTDVSTELATLTSLGMISEDDAIVIQAHVADAYGRKKAEEAATAEAARDAKEKNDALPYSQREWESADDGGSWNWWGGIDRDAKVRDKNDPSVTLSLKDLFKKLKEEENMSKKEARNYVEKLQNDLGISGSTQWWNWS